jgi:hypothetical protein
MPFANAAKFDRKSGGAEWRDLPLMQNPCPGVYRPNDPGGRLEAQLKNTARKTKFFAGGRASQAAEKLNFERTRG